MKYGIAVVLKNEHDYINEFIGYHVELGFTHFYILIDNICDEQPEYKNYIHPKYIEYVQFFYVDKSFDPVFYEEKIIKHNSNTHMYWINFFNKKVLPIVKKEVDWIAVFGCDSFLYLDGQKIDQYIKNVSDDVTQIAFQWKYVFNFDNVKCDLLTQNLDKFYELCSGDHSYTMGNTSKINNLLGHSHCFDSKSDYQYILLHDTMMIKFIKAPSPYDIFCRAGYNTNMKNYAIHIMLRCYDEMIIKDYFSWKNVNIENKNIHDAIANCDINKFNKNTQAGRTNYLKYYGQLSKRITSNVTTHIGNCISKHNNKISHYKTLIKKLLDANNLSDEQYNKFIQCVINKK